MSSARNPKSKISAEGGSASGGQNPKSHADLLFEIGTEEIPAAYLDGAIAQLREDAERCLREAHLDFKTVEAFGTPRRLVLWARELASTQHHPPEEIRGPSKQASFDAAGTPTPALTGFLKSRGGTTAQTKLVDTEKGSYVYLLKPARQVPTISVLPQLMTQLVTRLTFPKTMRWDESGLRFARPIRWHVVLYGSRVVPVRLGRLTSGRTTWVGGPKRPRAVSVTSPAQYFALLKRAGVIVDPYQRAGRVDQLVKTLAKQHGGVPAAEMLSHGLLDEVSALVEQPVALVGQFDPKYLVLPREVLLASMAKYQRVFAMQSSSGKLLPKFVAILDGKPRRLTDVRRTFEFILNARLADSLLFWKQDLALSIERMKDDLMGITFHEGRGSMWDKLERLLGLATLLTDIWKLNSEEAQSLRDACALSKADLASRIVREFPTLQGVMGKHYVHQTYKDSKGKERDKWEAVALAIEEHYLPLGGRSPKTLIGRALAILDKYDSLGCYFSLGIVPSGDQDPFGLRRAAQGIVEAAWLVGRPLKLKQLFEVFKTELQRQGLTGASRRIAKGAAPEPILAVEERAFEAVRARLHRYLLERLYTFNNWPESTPTADVIEAVRAGPCDDLVDVMNRIAHLTRLDGKPTLLKAAKVVERTYNIIKAADLKQSTINPNRFQEPLEHQLWNLYQRELDPNHEDTLTKLIQRQDYAKATERYGEIFFKPLHEFFDKVMVNVPDEAIQQNRLALMKAINVLYTDRIADLSKLAILQPRQLSA